jgi:hypothetical protein
MKGSFLLEKEIAAGLRESNKYTCPQVLSKGPIFGLGYRSPWFLGNIVQAEVTKKYNLNSMFAQQSAREIQRTGRSFQDVIDSASISAFLTGIKAPWGADADHLKTDENIKDAVKAGFTHFTFDLIDQVNESWQAVIDRITAMHKLTKNLMGKKDFTIELSLDETEELVKISELAFLMDELKKRKIRVDEVAPRFPGYFEKAIDYYLKSVNGKKIKDTKAFEEYLVEIVKLSNKYGFRTSVHSGSDKFTIYPIVARIAKKNFHLKTAGTFYLEELKVVAKYNYDLFKDVYALSLKQFKKDCATYELSANLKNLPDISKVKNGQMVNLLTTFTGNDDLRQVLHVTYGSVLQNKELAENIFMVLKNNKEDYSKIMSEHIVKHVEKCL